eukprot:TRINITY_DN9981_c0_g1_i2.p1 TRINITY_DN9981_c0_g1~~TRINITY_DN9981_c0_g1_i2.p1  ORF type:complete len:816 (+),score=133.12 TRINITY_DN9981_c0_g1_i2:482-2929(+)
MVNNMTASGWKSCYPPFKASKQETKDWGDLGRCGVDAPLGSLGYSGFRALRKPTDVIQYPGLKWGSGRTTQGKVTSYPLDDGVYFFDLRTDMTASQVAQKLSCMRQQNWLDDQTRSVHISFFVYNAARDLFSHTQLLLEITAEGNYNPIIYSNTFPYSRFSKGAAFVEVVVMLYVLFYIAKLITIFVRGLTNQSYAWRVMSVWTVVEIVNLVLFVIVYVGKIGSWAQRNLELDIGKSNDPVLQQKPAAEQQYWLLAINFAKLQNYSVATRSITDLSSINGLLCWLKVFKFLSQSPHFNLLSETLKRSFNDIVALIFYICVIMVGFTLMGHLLYGDSVDRFRSMGRSFGSLFRMVLGDFTYDDLNDVNREYTSAFFYLFILIMWLILLNMVIGIIAEGFTNAKEEQNRAIRTIHSYFLQKSAVVTVLERLPFVRTLLLSPKVRSPLRWNKIEGVPVRHLMNALETLRQSGEFATKEQIAEMLESYFASLAVSNPKRTHFRGKGAAIAEKIWVLFFSVRESVHTALALYEADHVANKPIRGLAQAMGRVPQSPDGNGPAAPWLPFNPQNPRLASATPQKVPDTCEEEDHDALEPVVAAVTSLNEQQQRLMEALEEVPFHRMSVANLYSGEDAEDEVDLTLAPLSARRASAKPPAEPLLSPRLSLADRCAIAEDLMQRLMPVFRLELDEACRRITAAREAPARSPMLEDGFPDVPGSAIPAVQTATRGTQTTATQPDCPPNSRSATPLAPVSPIGMPAGHYLDSSALGDLHPPVVRRAPTPLSGANYEREMLRALQIGATARSRADDSLAYSYSGKPL